MTTLKKEVAKEKDKYLEKKILETELELRKRIRLLDLKQITKKETKVHNLLDFIGFVKEE